MQVALENILDNFDKVAVAVSGGCDSMCLLHFLCHNAKTHGFSVIALNVEHGIRGESSLSDTEFVKNYCNQNNIPLLSYSVDAVKHAKENKLSIEQSARILRYQCFEDALKTKKCNKIATAHHRDDNVETVLFNLFRGTGLKGLSGIKKEREDGIVRPFLSLDRKDIEQYAKENDIPFVTDETNLTDDYTRNFLRHNVIPKIKEIFPEINKSVERLSDIVSLDDEYLSQVAESQIKINEKTASIAIPCHHAVLSRAIIFALKAMGVKKDWEKSHVDSIIELASLNNASKISLLNGITAVKEYDKIVFYREQEKVLLEIAVMLGETVFNQKKILIQEANRSVDLKSGLFADADKIPKTAVIRTRKNGDTFTKFGGGTKLLSDFFTDKKIPLRERDQKILIADGNVVLAIFGLAISDKIKVDETSENLVSLNILD